ncbi:trehalase family glycosidase [Ascidiimonas aurantiaca]|uniref:trehalase family glycosidase n=1 Tax=Ascidiimonas aurantiaca TaxID=1685432 RepID=UPI0030ED3F00
MFFKLKTKETLEHLLAQEDTDGDKKITREDNGPGCFEIETEDGVLYKVKGTYYLSNLLQELALAARAGKSKVTIPLRKIEEPPATRISRMIRYYFWDDLTRSVDEAGLNAILKDDKARESVQRIYVPATDPVAAKYFKKLQQKIRTLEVIILPKIITPEYVLSINNKPGILSLKIDKDKGVPFVVPGGRFNEMYGWDSYFENIGLLLDGRKDLAIAMIDNFCYQIQHYGKILNANRTYYLTRTQPPFLTSCIRDLLDKDPDQNIQWIHQAVTAAIQEYETVWMTAGKRCCTNGLNRYYAEGIGMPPETEEGHFDDILSKYALRHKIPLREFEQKYAARKLVDKELDLYFVHDRSLRESGHDTTWRLDNICASLNTVDLNSLLYVYETDLEYLLKTYFNGTFQMPFGKRYTSDIWAQKAMERKALIQKLLWNKDEGSFFDYDFVAKKQTGFASATNFYPLWARLCTPSQALRMVKIIMRDFRARGGILATSKASVQKLSKDRPQKQWDYPNGWAPHQMIIWKGLRNYGFEDEAQELIYRWLWMITKNAVDYNGTVPEKYDVVNATHKVYAEYGNVGTTFDYITTSGFGWMNASYQYGLHLLRNDFLKQLNTLTDPDILFSSP